MKLFNQINCLECMLWGWEKVRRNRGAAGPDGETIADFARDVLPRLQGLVRDIEHGAYAPGGLRHVTIPKRNGRTRQLSIPNIQDRVVQSAASAIIGPILDGEMEEGSFAYRPGRSVQMAVDRVSMYRRAGYDWVVEGDIEDYFNSIPHDRLRARLEQSINDDRVLDLIDLWLDAYGTDGVGLPQGSPISPLLANLYLDDIDEKIEDQGVRIVRFADDFIILCRSERKADKVLAETARLLEEYGLRLHPDKSRIVSFDEGFDFLGRLFVRSLVVRKEREDNQTPEENMLIPPPPDVKTPSGFDIPNAKPVAYQTGRLHRLYAVNADRRISRDHNGFRIETIPGKNRIERSGHEIMLLHASQVDRIDVFPDGEISQDALDLAIEHEIPVSFLNGNAVPRAVLGRPQASTDSKLHLLQAEHCINTEKQLFLARAFVEGRCLNQRGLLKRLNRKKKISEVDEVARKIGRITRKLRIATNTPEIMGVEAECAKLFWPCLGQLLDHGWDFKVRTRYRHDRKKNTRKPTEFDVLLDILSWQLTTDVETLVGKSGLHPGFAFLHSTQDNRNSLALDLVEEFRSPLVEGLAHYLVNNQTITREMFGTGETGTLFIRPEGRDRVFRAYEHWVNRTVKSHRRNEQTTWRGLMQDQVDALIAHIKDHSKDDVQYRPYVLDY